MTQGRVVSWALTLGLLACGLPAGAAPRGKADAASVASIDRPAFLAPPALICERGPRQRRMLRPARVSAPPRSDLEARPRQVGRGPLPGQRSHRRGDVRPERRD